MNGKLIKAFLSFLIPYWKKELVILFLIILNTVLSLASPYFLKVIIDKVIPTKNINQLILILSALVLIYVIRLGTGVISDYLNTWLSNKLVNDIKLALVSNLLVMPYSYFDNNKPGDIIQRVNNEVHKIQFFLTNSCIRFINNLFSIVGISVMLCLLNPKLFIISIAVFPFAIAINKLSKNPLKDYIDKSCKKEGELYNFYIDRVKNIKLIISFNSFKREINKVNSELTELFTLYLKTSVVSSLAGNAATFFVALGPILILGYGGSLIMKGVLTVGAVVAFIQYMNRLYAPTNDMVSLYVEYIKAKVSMERISSILIPDKKSETMIPKVELLNSISRIKLENISFSYGNKLVLENLSIDLTKGKRYGFVGMSGSGKSTLVKLLGKFYLAEKGAILINNDININNITRECWNGNVTILHQESLVLIETLRNNLFYGKPEATDEEIWNALDHANFSEFAKQLPHGLDTLIGEGGICLSGGQQQQVALARAFLKMSDLLILDESTSALDSNKEEHILNNLGHQFRDKIILSVSHRLSSIKDFDEIFVLENGKIVESGSHETLLSLNGKYFMLFKNQLSNVKNHLITSI